MFTARSPAGSSPPRHGDGRGSRGGPRSVTSSVSVVEVSTRAFGGIRRRMTVRPRLQVHSQFLCLARDTTWGKGTGRGWRALLYLRGVIEAIQQY
ncbi:hypothetical protein ALC57_15845 [Trachymyrmex cornetzi]|uniref:Uncharacterized protein n=1 Tax=Trachymyrmex cornetzi TaxID=471704 RepID=A0A151IW54_9HYME|nr:hypothetical protein ALC57_15845 [Trachymyrmex cornetzi]